MEQVKILIVDDEPSNLMLLETALRKNKCDAVKASSGEEAIKLSQKHDFALVIMDIQMPGIDGFEAATKIRSIEKTKDTPIIFITAIHIDEEYLFKGYQTGAVDYMFKPLKISILRSKVDVFIELYLRRKHLEIANLKLKEVNKDLVETNEDLKLARSQLIQSAKMALLGELETSVIHELNQPLFGISLYAENLLTHLEKENYHKLKPGLDNILNQVQRASVIIDHLRAFGRDTSDLEHEPAEINQVIDNSLLLTNEQLKVQGVKVVKALAQDLPEVLCNAIQIEQVLSNLIMNAQDAMMDAQKKEITIRSFLDDQWIMVEVADTGEGISAEDLEKIFNPFFTTKKVGKGIGLGLSISHNIINTHGGFLRVSSKKKQGTTFKIELPV